MSILFRSRQHNAEAPTEERSGTYSLRQLAIAMNAADGGVPAVSSIEEACRDAATWACLNIKAKNIAALPIDQIRYQGARRINIAPSAIIRRPSVLYPSRRYWVYAAAHSMFSDGNAFGVIPSVDSLMRPTAIDLVAPEDVTERDVVGGIAQAKVKGLGVLKVYPYGELWHMPGEVVAAGSPFGLSPIAYGSRVTGMALAAERFGGTFFTKGAHPTGILSVPGQPTEQQSKDLLQWLLNKDKREPLVLPAGTTYETIQINPQDSQFIELMRFTVEQTCRRHGVPPSMVYAAVSGQSVTYANVTQADLAFLKHTLSYPIDLFEDALSALIPQPQVVKMNRDAILEGDPEQRERIFDVQLKNRTRTINEVRALRDEDPFGPEYDEPGVLPMAAEQLPLPLDGTNSADVVGELRSAIAESREVKMGDTHFHLPDSVQVEMRQDPIVVPAPIVNVMVDPTPVSVAAPNVTVTAPNVTVEAPNVTVDSPVTVTPAPVTVMEGDRPSKKTVKIKRNDKGDIVSADVVEAY